ncbi:MAG: hypothetical protein HY037_05285 [Nitrospirae bacterium]|nr:hypothetical protein [Candidatus Troglogloeales bacterium]
MRISDKSLFDRGLSNFSSINRDGSTAVSFIVVFLILSAFTMRPSLLGEIFTPVSMAFAGAALGLTVIVLPMRTEKAVAQRNLLIASIICLFWVYLSLHSVFQRARHPDFLLKALLSISFLVFIFALILTRRDLNRIFFRGLVWVFVLSTLSYFTTLTLAFFVPFDSLFLFHIKSQFYDTKWGGVFLPFTTAYGVISISGFQFFRNLGPFREAGIFQAFLSWAYFVLPYLDMDRLWIKAVLVAGVLSTLSTTGIVIFFATLALKTVFVHEERRRLKRHIVSTILAAGMFAGGALTFLYIPVFGFIDKMQNSAASIEDRIEGTTAGISGFINNPFGIGMYNATVPNVGINLLSSLWMIGFAGLLILALLTVVSVITVKGSFDRMVFVISMFPFAVTGVLAQPFIESPLVFIMLFQILPKNTGRNPKTEEILYSWQSEVGANEV